MKWLILLIFIPACNSSDNIEENLPESASLNENEIGSPVITIMRGDIPLIKASSNTLIKNKTSNAILAGNVKADFFDADEFLLDENGEKVKNPKYGFHISSLTSDTAYIDQRTNNLRARGNVIVIADNDSLKLFSNSILWDNYYKKITSEDSVMFINLQNDTLHGSNFKSDMDLTRFEIGNPRGVKNN